MSGWQERYYRFKRTRDHRWLAAISACPAHLGSDIDVCFGRVWQLRTSTVAKVWIVLRFADRGVEELADGTLWVPDGLRSAVLRLLADWSIPGKWWTFRRAHFRTAAAQLAWEVLI
jgi:hypothetical protein